MKCLKVSEDTNNLQVHKEISYISVSFGFLINFVCLLQILRIRADFLTSQINDNDKVSSSSYKDLDKQ